MKYGESIFIFQLKMKTLLALDTAITHMKSKVKDKIKRYKIALLVIPSGLTWTPQLLDFSINKVFKESIWNKYVGFRIGKNNIKGLKSAIVEWIYEL